MAKVTTRDLYKKYPYIVAESKYYGSHAFWTEQQLWEAQTLNAPENTCSIRNGKFNTIDEITNPSFLAALKQLVNVK